MEPKVSVIIPVYNAEKYLRQCLDSVLNQTLREIEVICVNDGSTDGSLDILREYEQKDSRIVVLTQENQGAAVARNHGLSVARGECISVLDSDDFFASEMLEMSYKEHQKTDADIVIFRVNFYDEERKEYERCNWALRDNLLPHKKVFSGKDISQYLFQFCNGWAWDKLFSRAFITKYQLSFQSTKVFNDARFVFLSLALADKITVMKEVYATKRRSLSTSISSSRSKNWRHFAYLIDSLNEHLQQFGLYEVYERSFLNYALHLPVFLYNSIDQPYREELFEYLTEDYFPRYGFPQLKKDFFYNEKEYADYVAIMDRYQQRAGVKLVKDQVIYVIYATDEGYARYTATSMESAMMQAKSQNEYVFCVLVPQGHTECIAPYFECLEGMNDRCSIQIMESPEDFADARLQIEHITSPTFYRLLLPELLPDVSKCIYIDGDTLVCGDLAQMYSLNVEGAYLAGVNSLTYYKSPEYHCKRLGFDTLGSYLNAGVLLFNLDEMRKDNCVQRFRELLKCDFESQDQDILNVACREKIINIPYQYNAMTGHVGQNRDFLRTCISLDEFDRAFRLPFIIHYATKAKPWNDFAVPLAEKWWKFVLGSRTWKFYVEDGGEKLLGQIFSGNAKYVSRQYLGSVQEELDEVRGSWTYKIGRAITWVPRMIRGGIRCVKENGMSYTMDRVAAHLHLKPNRG